MPTSVLVCLSTCPDADTAQRIATALVSESLAACVNQWPGALSTYRWQGRVQTDPEIMLAIKTTADRFAAMEARLRALHPYDVPELVALEAVDGHIPYLDWVRAQVTP